MTAYGSFFRIRFINGLQYRAAAAAGVATQFAWGFLELKLFEAFYVSDPAVFPMAFQQVAAYVWLQQAFLALFMMWFLDGDIFAAITGGGIAYELARPLDLYTMWFIKGLAGRLSKAVLRCMPILLVAAFLPAPLRLPPPADLGAFLLFLLSLLLALLLVVALCMLLYVATFYTMSPLGVRIIALSLTDLLAGSLIPLPFFPDPVRRVVELTPFASMQNLPLRIYSANIQGRALWIALAVQAAWLLIAVAAGRFLMGRALRRVVVQGG